MFAKSYSFDYPELSFRHFMRLIVLSLLNFFPPRRFYNTIVSKAHE